MNFWNRRENYKKSEVPGTTQWFPKQHQNETIKIQIKWKKYLFTNEFSAKNRRCLKPMAENELIIEIILIKISYENESIKIQL